MGYLKSEIKILIVDDNPVFVSHFKNLLLNVAHNRISKIDIAYTGEEGLDMLFSTYYNYVFIDIDLPDMSGIELTRIFDRENSRKMTKVIAISLHNEFRYFEEMFAAGACKYLVKTSINYDIIEEILN